MYLMSDTFDANIQNMDTWFKKLECCFSESKAQSEAVWMNLLVNIFFYNFFFSFTFFYISLQQYWSGTGGREDSNRYPQEKT